MMCPLCCKEIIEDIDKLMVSYNPTKDWWVTRHYIYIGKDNPNGLLDIITDSKGHWKMTCGKANIQTVKNL